jgi:hypothetical protein
VPVLLFVCSPAIHVDKVNVPQWTECWDINYRGNYVPTLLPLYPKLIANMNVVIYSGTTTAQRCAALAASRCLLPDRGLRSRCHLHRRC